MKVALIGASGTLGIRVLDELLNRGHQVTGIVRRPDRLPEKPGLTHRAADASDADQIAAALAGHDAIVTTVPFLGLKVEELLAGVRRSGVKRILVSGSAGNLEVEPGIQLVGTRNMSEHGKPEHLDSREAFKLLRRDQELEWTYLAPAALLTPGKRTGNFRLGTSQLLKDKLGESRISMEDLAIVIVDEIENPQHIGRRFTAAY
ncbi:MAG TPA: NAD(P)H-binding protein [Stellaceae bacterium]|nr:NAD(P)H-binding protein [Stellaceae bacterium]